MKIILVQGIPIAYFPDTNCDFPKHFQEHTIVINLTLCMSMFPTVKLMSDSRQAVIGLAMYILILDVPRRVLVSSLLFTSPKRFANQTKYERLCEQ